MIESLLTMGTEMNIVLKVDGKEVVSVEIDEKRPATLPNELHVNLLTIQRR